MTDWSEHLEREIERYRDGESRLPEAGDPDAHQRQLTRMGNAAGGAGLALLMDGRPGDASEWLHRAAERYRESLADALATLAGSDQLSYLEAVERVLESFERRDEYLEDIPVADTVLVLQALAARRELAADLASALLPS